MSKLITVSDISEDQKEIIKKFRNAVQDILKPEHDDKYLLRWLKARDFNLTKAEKMIRESFKFRKKFHLDEILNGTYKEPEVLYKYKVENLLGFDNHGSLIALYLFGKADNKGMIYSGGFYENLKWFCYLLERDLKLMAEHNVEHGTEEDRITFIFDCQGLTIRSFTDRKVLNFGICFINAYQDNYPEIMKVLYMVNAPPVFNWVFNIFKPFLNEVTLSKIKIYQQGSFDWTEELFKNCDPKLIPSYLGGLLVDPDGNPKCKTILCHQGGKVPLSYYAKDKFIFQHDDPEVKSAVIRERSHFDYKVLITEPGSKIKWDFQTKNCNIHFGVFYRKNETSEADLDELTAVENVECHIIPESGEIHCEKSGEYILHFDNSYSWFTSKHLYFKVQIDKPYKSDLGEV